VTTIVYVDGFNFYYGAVKGTQYKWADFEKLTGRLIPNDQVSKIRYFTAPVKSRGSDPQGPERQAAFIRAISSNPLIEVHLGHFRTDPAWLPLAPGRWADATRPRVRSRRNVDMIQNRFEPRLSRPPSIRVLKTEEKGSDVNLASFLLYDTFKGLCSKALVISNDSDLAEPIKMVVEEGVVVGVVNPHRRHKMSRHLKNVASFDIQLRHQILAKCQMPSPVFGARGQQIHKPKTW